MRPQSYYHAKGPVGDLFRAAGPFTKVGVVGLGSGALSCYAEPGTSWTFFEIDPLVERIARDPALFTFLRNTAGRSTSRLETAVRSWRKLPQHRSISSSSMRSARTRYPSTC